MSEHTYRLDLTERERADLDDALQWAIDRTPYRAFIELLDKLRALQPIGTDGEG